MSVSQALATPVDEIMESIGVGPAQWVSLEPRCRVCRNDKVRQKVNDLLAAGASYARSCAPSGEDNADLDKCDQVTVDSVRNHCGAAFPVQNVAKATYREILERRAKANGVDFVEGVATAITPIAFFETVMVKSYETLVDSDTKVDVQHRHRRGGSAAVADRLQGLQPRSVGDEGPDGPDLRRGQVHCPAGDVGRRSSRSWRSWSSIRRRSTSTRTPSMTLTTTIPTTRPSSSTRTTSFDLRSDCRHRGRWGPLPVWTAAFAGSGGHARMARSTELRSGARYRMLNGLANE